MERCRILITTVIRGNTIIHQKHEEFQPCVGDNVVITKLAVHLEIEVMFVLDGHMTSTDWYINTC